MWGRKEAGIRPNPPFIKPSQFCAADYGNLVVTYWVLTIALMKKTFTLSLSMALSLSAWAVAPKPKTGPKSKPSTASADSARTPAKNRTKPARRAAPSAAAVAQSRADGEQDGPLGFRIGGATFTPGGFLDWTSVWRSTTVGSGIGTNFGSIPFSNTPAGQLSEFNESAQNSRLALKVTAHPGAEQVTGYIEADFLGALPANGHVNSNSNAFRMRLYWVDVRRGHWEVLAGQSWSLLTPNRKGLSPTPSNIFYTEDMDTNYQVGLVWSRDAQLRVIDHINRNWTLGVSLENPNQYIGSNVVLPNSAYASQFDTGSNTGASNPRPDIIAKLAYDGHWAGHRVHGEIAGLISGFHDSVPGTLATNSATGAGGELDGNIELLPHLDLVVNSFFSDGGGRYIFGLGPDLIVRPDGQISPVHSASTLDGFEYQFQRRWMVYGYYGAAYYGSNYVAGPGGPVGFGFPGSSGTSNRAIQEGTIGVIHTFWKQPRYGALQLITQYSYLTRAPWWIAPGAPRNASLNMIYADLRYVLP